MEIRIRRADAADTARVIHFYNDVIDAMAGLAYHPKWQKGVYPEEDFLRASCAQGEMYLTQEEESGELVGAMVINRQSNDGYADVQWPTGAAPDRVLGLHVLCVHPSHARRGIGRRMVDYAIALGRREGAQALRLDVIDGNEPALRLYTGAGFRLIASKKLFYEDTGWYTFHLFEYGIG